MQPHTSIRGRLHAGYWHVPPPQCGKHGTPVTHHYQRPAHQLKSWAAYAASHIHQRQTSRWLLACTASTMWKAWYSSDSSLPAACSSAQILGSICRLTHPSEADFTLAIGMYRLHNVESMVLQ